jgi:tetratricopeptide (TPR) repeat protein
MPDSWVSFHYSRAWLAKAGDSNPELLEQAVRWSKVAKRESDQIALLRGMAEYRAARYEEALHFLKGTEESKSLGRIAAGQLFTAMAMSKLGRTEEAAARLEQAEVRLILPLERLSGDWYYDMAYCQLALDEARQLLGGTNTPAAGTSRRHGGK